MRVVMMVVVRVFVIFVIVVYGVGKYVVVFVIGNMEIRWRLGE